MEIYSVTKFINELGHMRRVTHEGYKLAGVQNPLSIADHSLRAAQIGFILAVMEKYPNPAEICTMLVFHDMEECRIGDIHKVARKYLQINKEAVIQDQTSNLGVLGEQLKTLVSAVTYKSGTVQGTLAKDADYLEMAFTAKEYYDLGFTAAYDWIENVGTALRTESAKAILEEVKNLTFTEWWNGLKTFAPETKNPSLNS